MFINQGTDFRTWQLDVILKNFKAEGHKHIILFSSKIFVKKIMIKKHARKGLWMGKL